MTQGEAHTVAHGGWLAGANAIAMASGLAAALQLMWGHFASGGALLLLSVAVLRWPQSIWRTAADEDLPARQRLRVLFAVCAVAIFFRTYRLEPPGIWGDDAINGLLAFDVLDGKITSPFQLVTHAMSNFHALTNYTIAAAFWAFGPGPVTLRLPGVIASVLCVPLLYGTMAPLFGARAALLAAFFLASSPLQINHAKVLTQIVLGQFFLLLGLCVFVHGMTGSRRWLIAVAGAPLAFCLYTYHSAKLAPFIALVFILAELWHRRAGRLPLLLRSAMLAVVFVLCAVPAAVSYLQNPTALTQRVGGVALWPTLRDSHSLWPLWDAVWRTLMIFHYQQGPVYDWVGIGTDPALTFVVAFLFVHGMIETLHRLNQPRHVLLLGWVLIGLVPGFLSTEAPRVYRVFLASPPLYVWAALPIVQLWRCAAQTDTTRRWLRGALACIVLAVPLIDFNYYFYRVYTNRDFRWYQAARMVNMASALKAHGPGWTGYVLADGFSADYETLKFLSRAWGLTIRNVVSLADVLPVRDEPEGGVLFMMDRSALAASELMRSLYPDVALDVRTDPAPRTWWFDYWLPLLPPSVPPPPTNAFFPVSRQTADAIRGVTVLVLANDGSRISTRVDAQFGLTAPQDLPSGPAAPERVEWSGALYAPTDGTYGFELESAAAATVSIDGVDVLTHDTPRASMQLAQGLHPLTAQATVADSPVLRLWWQPPNKGLHDIPRRLLFRGAEVHGLLAEYEIDGRTLRRIEPYPYYGFFPDTFAGRFSVNWRGCLSVPAPGGYRLDAVASGRRSLMIDGRPWRPGDVLDAGVHDFEMQMVGVRGAARVQLSWQRADEPRALIPPETFTPPVASTGAVESSERSW